MELLMQLRMDKVPRFKTAEVYQLPKHTAFYLKGKDLAYNQEDKFRIDELVKLVINNTYPTTSRVTREYIGFYSSVDLFNSQESDTTDWWILLDKFNTPAAYVYAYGGGIERKRKKEPNFAAYPRLFYVGNQEAVLEHIGYTSPQVFKQGFDFPFVVDEKKVETSLIDYTISTNAGQKVYFSKAKNKGLPFTDEIRMWVNRGNYNYQRNIVLPPTYDLRQATEDDYDKLKKFLNHNHRFNSLDPRSLKEENGIFFIITSGTPNNGERIVASAGLSYPTLTPDGRRLLCATDLATEEGEGTRRKGLATAVRAATLNKLFYGENGWFQGEKAWSKTTVVSDIEMTGFGAKAMTQKLGYNQVFIEREPYVRRWFTVSTRPKNIGAMAE